jgi:hypothetical protein
MNWPGSSKDRIQRLRDWRKEEELRPLSYSSLGSLP